MYIISIVDSFPDGKQYDPTPKITKSNAVEFVRNTLRYMYRSTEIEEKRRVIGRLVTDTSFSKMDGFIGSGEYYIAYSIVDRDIWEDKKNGLIENLNNEITSLKEFIEDNQRKVDELNNWERRWT